ncbi:MAG: MTH938/NDUFAF3 family protein, partial [Cypionkella sp.]
LPPAFIAALDQAGIGVEPMNTPAAARTYNVLLGEGRRVAAALLPVL